MFFTLNNGAAYRMYALIIAALFMIPSSMPAQSQNITPEENNALVEEIRAKDRSEQLPQDLEGVEIVEKLDNQLPLENEFVDSNGQTVKLGNYFQGDKPVILNLGYYRCPMLCSLVANGMVDALKDVEMTPGIDFEIITLSIDPLETPQLAKHNKNNYIKEYGRPSAAGGWHFLTGKEDNIKEVADAVGFGYKYNDDREEYAHGSAIFVIKPDGKVSRYLYGILFDPQTLRLSLVEASEGKIGTTLDKVLLFCYHYDATKGKYAPMAMNIMRMGGGLTVIILLAVLSVFWRREIRRKRNTNTVEEGN